MRKDFVTCGKCGRKILKEGYVVHDCGWIPVSAQTGTGIRTT